MGQAREAPEGFPVRRREKGLRLRRIFYIPHSPPPPPRHRPAISAVGVAGDGDPYGVYRNKSETCNAGRQEWRPLRRLTRGNPKPATGAAVGSGPYGVNGTGSICRNYSIIQRSLPPLPPSYEEGALRRGAGAIF